MFYFAHCSGWLDPACSLPAGEPLCKCPASSSENFPAFPVTVSGDEERERD